MASSKLLQDVKHVASDFRRIVNQRDYLFKETPVVQDPTLSKSGDQCFLYVPAHQKVLKLVDELGTIRGGLSYRLSDTGELELFRYSVGFEHANTFVEFYEYDEGKGKARYKFHYDFDIDAAKEHIHPLSHVQIDPLSVPRFRTIKYNSGIEMFTDFLQMIEASFYTNNAISKEQTPRLECRHTFLTEYQ